MGATIYWAPSPKGEVFPVGLRSRFITLMCDTFGSYPWTLTHEHVFALSEAAEKEEASDGVDDALHTLVRLIVQHGSITVWPEY